MHLKKLFLSILLLAVINVSVAQKLSQRLLEKIVKHIELKHLNDRMVRTETDSTIVLDFFEKNVDFDIRLYTFEIPKVNYSINYDGCSILVGDINQDGKNEPMVSVYENFGGSGMSFAYHFFFEIDGKLYTFLDTDVAQCHCALIPQNISNNGIEFLIDLRKSLNYTSIETRMYKWKDFKLVLVK